MSCVGLTTGFPSCGFKILLAASIKKRHSACASTPSGTMHRHLVTVKVGVIRSTNQRMNFKRFTFHQNRLESLNTKSVQCRGHG